MLRVNVPVSELVVFWLAEIIELGSVHFIIVFIVSRKRVDAKVDCADHHFNEAKHITQI